MANQAINQLTSKEVVLQELKKIGEEKGLVRSRDVVDYARDERSALHTYFDWDDSTAGEKYRLWQARQLIASVRVEFVGKQTDAYFNVLVPVNDHAVQGYASIEQVLSDDDLYTQVITSAIKELRHWQKKYKEVAELKGVVNQDFLDELEHNTQD